MLRQTEQGPRHRSPVVTHLTQSPAGHTVPRPLLSAGVLCLGGSARVPALREAAVPARHHWEANVLDTAHSAKHTQSSNDDRTCQPRAAPEARAARGWGGPAADKGGHTAKAGALPAPRPARPPWLSPAATYLKGVPSDIELRGDKGTFGVICGSREKPMAAALQGPTPPCPCVPKDPCKWR